LVRGAKAGDVLFFHYSGHGSQLPNFNPNVDYEPDGLDEILCPIDLDFKSKVIKDDDFKKIVKNVPKGVNLTVILDCCLSKDTRIQLLDGTNPTIEELSHRSEPFWVYSSKENGEIVPGLAHSARMTGHRELIKITLDNDDFLECTSDHKILMRDGTYKEAGQLQPQDSLMPLYKKYEEVKTFSGKKINIVGYEKILTISNKNNRKWDFTHRIVRDYFNIYDKENKKTVCHHKNFNKLDNRPENLLMMEWCEHQKCHGDLMRKSNKKIWAPDSKLRKYRKTEEYRKSQSEIIKKSWQDDNIKNKHLEGIQKSIEAGTHPTWTKRNRSTNARITSSLVNYWRHYLRKQNISQGVLPFKKWRKDNEQQYLPKINERLNNHKVNKIEKTGRIEPVYDLTVDKYHNFAVESGIFVHNCHSGDGLRHIPNPTVDDDNITSRFLRAPDEILKGADTKDLPINTTKLQNKYEEQVGILISGCKSNQTSADALIKGTFQGAATYLLGLVLSNRKYSIDYRNLVRIMNDGLKSRNFTQAPELNCAEEYKDLDFLEPIGEVDAPKN